MTKLGAVNVPVCLLCYNRGPLGAELKVTFCRPVQASEVDTCTFRRAVMIPCPCVRWGRPLGSKHLKRLSNSRHAEFDPSWPCWTEPDYLLKGDSQQAAYVLVNRHTGLFHDVERTEPSPICLPAQVKCPGWCVELGVNTYIRKGKVFHEYEQCCCTFP